MASGFFLSYIGANYVSAIRPGMIYTVFFSPFIVGRMHICFSFSRIVRYVYFFKKYINTDILEYQYENVKDWKGKKNEV